MSSGGLWLQVTPLGSVQGLTRRQIFLKDPGGSSEFIDTIGGMDVSCRGVLFVDVRQCEELASGDYTGGSSDPYVLLKVAGQKQQTVVYPHTTSPVYNAHFEFFNVQAQDVLQVQVSSWM